MAVDDYLLILKKILVKNRSVIKESHRYYKLYLPAEYNALWGTLYKEKRRVD